MNRIILQITALFLLSPLQIFSQWDEVTNVSESSGEIWDLKEFDGKLFIVGLFQKNEGYTSNYSAYYENGVMYQDSTDYGNGGFMSLEVFNNQLWGGTALFMSGDMSGVSYWDGSEWLNGEGSMTNMNGVSGIFADGNDLYAGVFGSELIMKTGTGMWNSLAPLDVSNDDILDITKYNDSIVVAGKISTSNSTTINNIGYYDGSGIQPYGDGTDGTIQSVIVYNGELYAAGSFANAGGNPANFIAKWDGTNWSDVGGSVTGSGTMGIYDLLVYNNKLYAVGDFDEIGGVSSTGAAYWDGTDWNDINFPAINGFPRCMEVMDYYLYVGTDEESGAVDTSHVYRMPLSLASLKENNEELKLSLFPNPANDKIMLTANSGINKITVFDKIGKEVIELDIQNAFNYELSLLDIEAGIYFIHCETDIGNNSIKFIKR